MTKILNSALTAILVAVVFLECKKVAEKDKGKEKSSLAIRAK